MQAKEVRIDADPLLLTPRVLLPALRYLSSFAFDLRRIYKLFTTVLCKLSQ